MSGSRNHWPQITTTNRLIRKSCNRNGMQRHEVSGHCWKNGTRGLGQPSIGQTHGIWEAPRGELRLISSYPSLPGRGPVTQSPPPLLTLDSCPECSLPPCLSHGNPHAPKWVFPVASGGTRPCLGRRESLNSSFGGWPQPPPWVKSPGARMRHPPPWAARHRVRGLGSASRYPGFQLHDPKGHRGRSFCI